MVLFFGFYGIICNGRWFIEVIKRKATKAHLLLSFLTKRGLKTLFSAIHAASTGSNLGMLRVATGRVGSGNSKFSTGRVGSGQQIWKFHGSGRVTGQPTIFQRVGGSKGKMLRVRRVKSRKFTGQKFFTKIEIFCKYFGKIYIYLTKNRDFWPKSLRFCENISRKYITGNAGQEQFFSRV